jgi:subtilisin family serine protease
MRLTTPAMMMAALAVGFVATGCQNNGPGGAGAGGAGAPTAMVSATAGDIQHAGDPKAVPGSYIVVLKDAAVPRATVPAKAAELAHAYGGRVGHVYTNALGGFEVAMPEQAAGRLAADPLISYVEQNRTVTLAGTQTNPPSWGLDRIDRRNLPLNGWYDYANTGSNVRVYIIDTGIRFSHVDFGGRAVTGFDAVDGGNADDCNGHGTHVAGTVGGSTYGVAKGVTLVGVRVLDCSGVGTYAQVISGVDWVTGDHDPGELAVANMSLGGPASTALDTAVTNSIADGVTYAVAAGNSSASACGQSPAKVPNAITVGATDKTDARAWYSNSGTCLDMFAPGTAITSAWATSDTAKNTLDGTSMASPHVAGAAALVLSNNPSFTPQQVRDKLVADATSGVVTDPGIGSPNLLLDTMAWPTTLVAPAAGSSGNRSVAVFTQTDGTVHYDWWDLGGGSNGDHQVPGGFLTDATPAAALVNNGKYLFVLAKKPGPNADVFLNQGTPGVAWNIWKPLGFKTSVAPAAASSGNRSVALITATDGTIHYDWWDLGGGSNGDQKVPEFLTDTTPAAALVNNGNDLFVLAKQPGPDADVFLNHGTPGGAWSGWQRLGFKTDVAPAAASWGNRSVALITATDGTVHYVWWDLNGFRKAGVVPGGFLTDATPAGALVGSGKYLFVLAKTRAPNADVYLNQGTPGGAWVGWLH